MNVSPGYNFFPTQHPGRTALRRRRGRRWPVRHRRGDRCRPPRRPHVVDRALRLSWRQPDRGPGRAVHDLVLARWLAAVDQGHLRRVCPAHGGRWRRVAPIRHSRAECLLWIHRVRPRQGDAVRAGIGQDRGAADVPRGRRRASVSHAGGRCHHGAGRQRPAARHRSGLCLEERPAHATGRHDRGLFG